MISQPTASVLPCNETGVPLCARQRNVAGQRRPRTWDLRSVAHFFVPMPSDVVSVGPGLHGRAAPASSGEATSGGPAVIRRAPGAQSSGPLT